MRERSFRQDRGGAGERRHSALCFLRCSLCFIPGRGRRRRRLIFAHLSNVSRHLEACEPFNIAWHVTCLVDAPLSVFSRICSPVFSELVRGVLFLAHATIECNCDIISKYFGDCLLSRLAGALDVDGGSRASG